MENNVKMQEELSPELQQAVKRIRDNFLICCVKRAGGRLEFPVDEVDNADDLLVMTVEGFNIILTTTARS